MSRDVLRAVRVYRDGAFGDAEDVVIDGSVIGNDSADGRQVASGGYLIPGLIDCHIHLYGPETLRALASYGVTSGMDMSSPAPLVAALRGTPRVTDIRSPLMAANSPKSAHAARMKDIPAAAEAVVSGVADVDAWVSRHVQQGADYIKVVIDLPGFDQQTVDALVAAAHAHGLKVVAHASRSDAVAMAQRAGVDILTHAPLDRPIADAQAAELVAAGTVIVPTLTMMQGIVENLHAAGRPGPVYEPARSTVATLHAAGMPILAGTDANATPAAPASPVFGESLHDELGLLVDAGLTPAQALDAATAVAAEHFGLADRGAIAPGLRADLVLLAADPTVDIAATRTIRGVWIAGEPVARDG
ncbi:MAG: amidohydrolase family protein [Pseudonocardia sp.]|nr:amidohydrolase family protein [Pseudonocardia sp.]